MLLQPCPHCDYEMSGNTSQRCPECGAAFGPVDRKRAKRRGQLFAQAPKIRRIAAASLAGACIVCVAGSLWIHRQSPANVALEAAACATMSLVWWLAGWAASRLAPENQRRVTLALWERHAIFLLAPWFMIPVCTLVLAAAVLLAQALNRAPVGGNGEDWIGLCVGLCLFFLWAIGSVAGLSISLLRLNRTMRRTVPPEGFSLWSGACTLALLVWAMAGVLGFLGGVLGTTYVMSEIAHPSPFEFDPNM